MSSYFEDLGRKLGRAAVPALRKSKWIWDGLTGTEEEALAAERDLGATLAAELRHATEVVEDPDLLGIVREVCARLEPVVDQAGFSFRCELNASEHPSIIGLPGGHLFVGQSLMEFCQGDPHEIAFLIAHETAHIVRRHTWDRMIQQSALRAVSFAARSAGPLSGWMQSQGLPMLRSAHEEGFEFIADADAIGLVSAAGYDHNGAISVLRRIEEKGTDPGRIGEYFASHPAPEKRIMMLKGGSLEGSSERN